MSKLQRGLQFYAGGILLLFSLAGCVLPTIAQTGTSNAVGVPPVVPEQPGLGHSIIGVEFGVGQNMQQETFTCPCGAAFSGGKGMGWNASAFFELPIGPDFFAGVKAGRNLKNTTSTYSTDEIVMVETNSGQVDTVPLPTNRTGSLSLTLLSFEPFIQYQILSTNFFVQIGAGISDLTSSNFTQTRMLTSSSITLSDGSTINNPVFTNGARSETIQYGALTNANSLLFSGTLSAGYNFVSEHMSLAPMVTYDYPFSSPQSGGNWKIASLYASLSLGFKLN